MVSWRHTKIAHCQCVFSLMVLTLVISLVHSLPGSPLQSHLVPVPVRILHFPSSLTRAALSEGSGTPPPGAQCNHLWGIGLLAPT